eukprot:TRINITY_DN1026_c0_g1_i5.p1 TRINITY_DN1026_c0_g1~~TRINITY_DN1026_c0_g1_i5.p1  ORF type:complete len:917 (-),score=248.42 TRINITY_DN1026_c0_g1_i5:581-3112(-)
MEEHSHAYHDQYQQAADPLLTEAHKSSLLPSVHQQFSFSVTTSHRPQVDHLQDSASFVSGRASFYVPDGSVSYDARDGAFSADSNPFAPPQENVLTNSSIYQQEVPSSYSSIPGTTEAGNQNEQFHKALVSSISSNQEQLNPQTTLPAVGSSASAQQPHFTHWDQSVEAINDPNDRASIFDHVSPHDHDSRQKASYMYPNPAGHSGDVDRIAAVSSVHAWTPAVVAGGVFSPIPPVPSGPQFDPTFISHSSAPGQPAPVFGGIPRPSFRPTIPSAGASFGLGAGTALHPTTAFPGDSNGVFNVSERPKKASVPNWLREEIIKKKVAIASSSIQGHAADDSFHLSGTEADDKSFKEGDETDSRSVDSTHSAEGEEDDDDDVEVARSAAINLEIKHILTEVLLKVTDELFDEIATKVLSEDDMTVEVDNGTDSARHKISPPPAVPTPKASAKVLVPVIVKNVKVNDATEKSNSSSPGDVLGLANYASEEEEVQSSSMRSARQINGDAHRRSSNDRTSEDVLMEEKGTKLAVVEEQEETLLNSPLKYNGEGCTRKKGIHADNELVYDGAAAATRATPRVSEDQFIVKGSKMVEVSLKQTYDFESKDNVDGKFYMKHESECGNAVDLKSTTDEFQVRDDLSKSKKNDGNEGKRSSVSKVIVKEADDAVKVKAKQKHSDSGEPRRGKDRNVGKEHTDERNNGLKERIKDRDVKREEKVGESDSRKSSKHSNNVKEDRKGTEKSRRVSAKEEDNRKRERTRDEKEDRSRHRDPRDSRRYKRQLSPSVSRGKNVRDNSLADNISDSSDETSDNSRQRKLRSNKRSLSPSPVRSPRRRRRSRSGTPVRRRR